MKNIIISGCSRGIGRALVKSFCTYGNIKIIGISRNEEALQLLQTEVKKEFTGLNVSFVPLAADITKAEEREQIREYLEKHELPVDILVNNAGFLAAAPFRDTCEEDFDRMFAVNAKAPFFLVQSLLPLMHEGTHVVNISSMGGVQGSVKFPGLSAYSASKGALCIMTEALAEELKEEKISVNALAYGAVQTEMLAEAFPGYKPPMTAENMASWTAAFCLNGQRFFNGKVLPVSNSTP